MIFRRYATRDRSFWTRLGAERYRRRYGVPIWKWNDYRWTLLPERR